MAKDTAHAPDRPDPDDLKEAGRDETGRNEAPRSPLSGIGSALRRLRMHRGLRQYEAAEAAGITKAMLSAYETGKRRPSLKTLGRLLGAIHSNLGDLHVAMMEERRGYRTARPRRGEMELRDPGVELREPPAPWAAHSPRRPDLYGMLGIDGPLPQEEERALEEMLAGFLKLLRFMHRNLAAGETAAGVGRGPYDG